MKKHIIMAVMFVSCLLLLAACGRPVDRDNTSDSSTEPSQAVASSTIQSESAGIQQSSSAKNNIDYSKYSGTWVNSKIKGTDIQRGGTYMDIKVDASGQVSGNISTSSNNLGHIAQFDFDGKIENNKMKIDFKSDGWYNAGTVTFDFKEEEIDSDITVHSSQSSPWSIQTGKITFVRE